MRRNPLKIHAICLALNEDPFIENTIKGLYDSCSGISVITQYDRDYYNNFVIPDNTIYKVVNYPDPSGKIHLVVRRFKDETAARNHEMLAICNSPTKGIMDHGNPLEIVNKFHEKPDYFLIVDADEIYEPDVLGNMLQYLSDKRPSGMRTTGRQYLFTWNQLIPKEVVHHHHFGFIKAGFIFEQRRVISWNESRLQKLLTILGLPDFSAKIYGFIDCPEEVGVYHHGSYLGGIDRLERKFKMHSHPDIVLRPGYVEGIVNLPFTHLTSEEIPNFIKNGVWPDNFFDPQK